MYGHSQGHSKQCKLHLQRIQQILVNFKEITSFDNLLCFSLRVYVCLRYMSYDISDISDISDI